MVEMQETRVTRDGGSRRVNGECSLFIARILSSTIDISHARRRQRPVFVANQEVNNSDGQKIHLRHPYGDRQGSPLFTQLRRRAHGYRKGAGYTDY